MRTTVSRLNFAAIHVTKNVRFSSLNLWALAAALLLAFILPVALQAQNFVYVTNRTLTTNTVSGFAVDAGGLLTPVPGSPFSTGGVGANILCAAVDRITRIPRPASANAVCLSHRPGRIHAR